MGSGGQKQDNDSYFNIFGRQASNDSWNPLERSKSVAKWFIVKVIVFLLCLKLSWNFLKSMVMYPFTAMGTSTKTENPASKEKP